MNKEQAPNANPHQAIQVDFNAAGQIINGENGKYLIKGISMLILTATISYAGLSAYGMHNGYDVKMSLFPPNLELSKIA